MILYVDGLAVGATADTRSQASKPVSFLAATKENPPGSLKGAVDEIAVYEKALSPARVKAHHDAAR